MLANYGLPLIDIDLRRVLGVEQCRVSQLAVAPDLSALVSVVAAPLPLLCVQSGSAHWKHRGEFAAVAEQSERLAHAARALLQALELVRATWASSMAAARAKLLLYKSTLEARNVVGGATAPTVARHLTARALFLSRVGRRKACRCRSAKSTSRSSPLVRRRRACRRRR